MTVNELKEKRYALLKEARAVLDGAKDGKLTSEEKAKYDKIVADVDKSDEMIQTEERQAKMEKVFSDVPKLETKPEKKDEERAFKDYLEKRDLAISTSTGIYAPQAWVNKVIESIIHLVPLMDKVTRYDLIGNDSLGIPYVSTAASDAAWTDEVPDSDISADSTLALSKRELKPYPLVKLIKISDKLSKVSALPIDDFIRNTLAQRVANTVENAILNGDGTGEPLGVYQTTVITTAQDVEDNNTATELSADSFIAAYYKAKVRPGQGMWVVSPTVMKEIRQLRDDANHYIFSPALGNITDTILGAPVYLSDYAPTSLTADSYVAIYGDFSYYYLATVRNIQIQVLSELFQLKNQVGYKAVMYADGMPVIKEPFARVQMASA